MVKISTECCFVAFFLTLLAHRRYPARGHRQGRVRYLCSVRQSTLPGTGYRYNTTYNQSLNTFMGPNLVVSGSTLTWNKHMMPWPLVGVTQVEPWKPPNAVGESKSRPARRQRPHRPADLSRFVPAGWASVLRIN